MNLNAVARQTWTHALALAAVLVFAQSSAVVLAASPPQADTLVILTWSEYMDPEVVAAFEAEHGTRVRFVYFETDDARTSILAERDGNGFDLVLVNGASMHGYARRGWLAPVAALHVPNRANIDPRWLRASPDIETYGTAYLWGTTGIGYRKDLYAPGLSSWKELLEPGAALRGRILMVKTMRDSLGVALKALGHSANSVDTTSLDAADRLLQAQKPYVKAYSYLSLGKDSALVTGDVWAAVIYSGDALTLQQYDPNITYVVPREGALLWVDYLAVASRSTNKELAAKFLDFINRPKVAAANASFVNYATPNLKAIPHLSKAHLEDPVIYPDPSTLDRSEMIQPVGPRVVRKMNGIFSRLVN